VRVFPETPFRIGAYHPNVTVAALLSAYALTFPPIQGPVEPNYAATWERVKNNISTRYFARQQRKDEMEKLFGKYGPIASKAKSKEEFSSAVNGMIRDFGDSHFDFLTTEDQGFYTFGSFIRQDLPDLPHIGAWFKKSGDGYTVQMVLQGTPAAEHDIRKGDLVTLIDGKPFLPVSPLRSKIGEKVKLTLKRQGQTLEKEVEVRAAKGMNLFLEATRNSVKIIDHGGKKIGYIHLWTMANDDFRNALSNAVYGRLKDTDGFILDIRDGFGGRPEGFGDPFFRPEANLEWKMSPSAGFTQLFGYGRPLVVITNEGSRSAKEVFAYLIKKSGRGTLVGTTTAGHVLGTSPVPVDDWGMLEIPMVDVIADGIRIEGKGIAPDVEVKPEFDSSGKDMHLAKALEVVTAKIGAGFR